MLERAVVGLELVQTADRQDAGEDDRQPQEAGRGGGEPSRIGPERESEEQEHDCREEERAHGRVPPAELGQRVLARDGDRDPDPSTHWAHRAAVAGRGSRIGVGGAHVTPLPLTSDTSPRSRTTCASTQRSSRSVLWMP